MNSRCGNDVVIKVKNLIKSMVKDVGQPITFDIFINVPKILDRDQWKFWSQECPGVVSRKCKRKEPGV